MVGEVTQQLDKPHPGTYLGKGKIEELRERITALDASVVIFDDELSPSQAKNIEDSTATRVIDRAELILDIFATRARSSEAKMQVELAQLEYSLPRLTRMWTHLEKFRGGIGVRGPGETQLETDRRLIHHRIKLLKERLEDVIRSREVQRQGRKGQFTASLVGYTNAGKSSVLRALSGQRDIFVEDRLFATLDPLTREVNLGDGEKLLVTDTVGFIRKLPHDLVASFRATLEEARESEMLLHVIDASHPSWEEQRIVVDDVLSDLALREKPTLHVFNKIDLLSHEAVIALQERMSNLLPNSVFISTMTEEGIEPLRRALLARLHELRPIMELRLDAGDGKLLAEIHRDGHVLDQRSSGSEMIVRARLDASLEAKLRRMGTSMVPRPGTPA